MITAGPTFTHRTMILDPRIRLYHCKKNYYFCYQLVSFTVLYLKHNNQFGANFFLLFVCVERRTP